jgi:hypothetical protein
MTGNEDNQQSPTPSAPTAPTEPPEAQLFLSWQERDSVSVKCSDCSMVTRHQHYIVTPNPVVHNFSSTPENLQKIQKATKRLLMCDQCGKMSLKN